MMEGQPSAKRPRLSMACNECRRRKVRCDSDYPRCKNCRLRNSECFTSDPRRPDIPVRREWIESFEKPFNQPEDTTEKQSHYVKSTSQHSGGHTKPLSPVASMREEETQDISPVQQPFEMSFNLDKGTNRIKMLGGSSSQCLSKSLDLYFRSVNIEPVSQIFRHGMRHSEEMNLPLGMALPSFPDFNHRQRYLSAFFTRIHTLYPMLDIDEYKNAVHRLSDLPNLRSLSNEQIPMLASAFLILSMGADEEAQKSTSDGEKFLQAAASLLGHVVLIPYLPAVQALLLYAICYRGRNKDGVGWQMLGMATRVAHTIGLHKHSAIHPSDQHGIQQKGEQLFHARVWAVCCCLEKLMQLELGRPSAIAAVDCDQMMGRDQRPPGPDFLQWNMALAEIQGHVSHHIYGHRPGDRTARQILLDTARLDQQLMEWQNRLPPDIRPGNDLVCADDQLHIAVFFSIQYHQTMIALHRAALVASPGKYEAEVLNQCADEPSQGRLRGGEAICVNSARSIARLKMELLDCKTESRILTAGPALLACITLAISSIKHPGSRKRASDLELLKACAEYTTDQFNKSGCDKRFSIGALTIYEKVRGHIHRYQQEMNGRAQTTSKQNTSLPTLNAWEKLQPTNQDTSNSVEITVPSATLMEGERSSTLISQPSRGINGSRSFQPNSMESPKVPTIYSESSVRNAGSTATPSSDDLVMDRSLEAGISAEEPGNLVPFQGSSVEELWNWMLLMDSENPPGNGYDNGFWYDNDVSIGT